VSSAGPTAEPSRLDEISCLESMRRGDPGCLADFFEVWGDRLYRLALRLTGDPATAEDVVQEAFVKLMAGAGTIEGRSRLATWLYRVVYNASIDRLRDRKRTVPVPEEGDDEAPPMPALLVDLLSPEEMLKDEETRRALDGAIAALPAPLRAAFLLRDVEGLTTAEAAEVLSLTETNLKVRLHRARLFLRERLSASVAGRARRQEGRA
jgi:RNA polymerase sigma-70 factor, ECF subfamily